MNKPPTYLRSYCTLSAYLKLQQFPFSNRVKTLPSARPKMVPWASSRPVGTCRQQWSHCGPSGCVSFFSVSIYCWLLLRMVWPNSLVSRSLLPQLLHQASRWNDSCDVCSHNKHISPPWHGHVRQRPPMLYWGHPHKRTVLCGYHRFGTPIKAVSWTWATP